MVLSQEQEKVINSKKWSIRSNLISQDSKIQLLEALDGWSVWMICYKVHLFLMLSVHITTDLFYILKHKMLLTMPDKTWYKLEIDSSKHI